MVAYVVTCMVYENRQIDSQGGIYKRVRSVQMNISLNTRHTVCVLFVVALNSLIIAYDRFSLSCLTMICTSF